MLTPASGTEVSLGFSGSVIKQMPLTGLISYTNGCVREEGNKGQKLSLFLSDKDQKGISWDLKESNTTRDLAIVGQLWYKRIETEDI